MHQTMYTKPQETPVKSHLALTSPTKTHVVLERSKVEYSHL